jgi:hypothetical protein
MSPGQGLKVQRPGLIHAEHGLRVAVCRDGLAAGLT